MRTLFLLTADITMRGLRHDKSTARIEALRVDTPGPRPPAELPRHRTAAS
jgi:hypothetical protein